MAVYCDPDTYPLAPPVHPGVRMAIGVHPRQIPNFTNSAEIHFLAGSSIMALGEVGLDLTETRVSIQSQEHFLNYFLSRYCWSSRTLVLHIRGNNSAQGLALYSRPYSIVSANPFTLFWRQGFRRNGLGRTFSKMLLWLYGGSETLFRGTDFGSQTSSMSVWKGVSRPVHN